MSFVNKDLSANESQISSEGKPRISVQSNGTNASLDVEKKHGYEDVLEILGFGKTQWIMLLTCGLLLMVVINETMGMSIITIASQCDFESSSMDKAIMSAAAFIGE